jgi:hypothetical protein
MSSGSKAGCPRVIVVSADEFRELVGATSVRFIGRDKDVDVIAEFRLEVHSPRSVNVTSQRAQREFSLLSVFEVF